MYDFWQFLHVTSAIVWVGSATLSLFLLLRLGKLGDPSIDSYLRLADEKSVPLFASTSMLTLVTGLVMAFGWVGFGPLWIKIGLAGIFVSMVMGFGYFLPTINKIKATVAERGAEDPSVVAMSRQITIVSGVELAIFLVVVWAMVTKPG